MFFGNKGYGKDYRTTANTKTANQVRIVKENVDKIRIEDVKPSPDLLTENIWNQRSNFRDEY